MAKYCRRPKIVEAVRWLGFKNGPEGLGIVPTSQAMKDGLLTTQKGSFGISPGDWVLTDAHGAIDVCIHEDFLVAYEAIEGEVELT